MTIDEGTAFSGGGWFTDPGADTWEGTVDFGSGGGEQLLPLSADKTFDLDFVYTDSGVFTVTVTVTDDDEGSASATFTVHVDNVAPSVFVDGPVEGHVDSPVTVVVSASDPSLTDMQSDFTYRIDWDGDALVDQIVTGPAAGVDVAHTFTAAGDYTIVVVAIDKDGDVGPPAEYVLTIREVRDCSIGGYVYLDVNDNGIKDAAELALPNVPVTLTGDATRTVLTDEHGWYEFTHLSPGKYHVAELQPTAFIDGKDTPGEPLVGQCGNDMFYDMQLPSRAVARDYNFGEMGLIAELISMNFFLASTPNGQALLSTVVAPTGAGWFTLAVPEDGEFVVRLNERVENPSIEFYTQQMMPVALSRDEHSLAAPVSQGENYVLHIAGDTGGRELRANLAIMPQSPVTDSARRVLDVNDDGWVSPLDALLVINQLNDTDPSTVVVIGSVTCRLDVDGNGRLSPLDALLIINHLNRPAEGEDCSGDATLSQSPLGGTLWDASDRVAFTPAEDLLTGELSDVDATDVADELRRNADMETDPYSGTAKSQDSSVSRWDARTGVLDPHEMPPWDANGDGLVSPIDALLVINYLNARHAASSSSSVSLDVNADGTVAPLDALLVISFLNNRGQAEGEEPRLVAVPKQAVVALPLQDAVPTAMAEMGDREWPGVQIPAGSPEEDFCWSDDLEDLLSTIAGDVERGWNDAK